MCHRGAPQVGLVPLGYGVAVRHLGRKPAYTAAPLLPLIPTHESWAGNFARLNDSQQTGITATDLSSHCCHGSRKGFSVFPLSSPQLQRVPGLYLSAVQRIRNTVQKMLLSKEALH